MKVNKKPKIEYNGYYIQEFIPNNKYFIIKSDNYSHNYISSKSSLNEAKIYIDQELNQI